MRLFNLKFIQEGRERVPLKSQPERRDLIPLKSPPKIRGRFKRGLIILSILALLAPPALAFGTNALINWQAPYVTFYPATFDNLVMDFSLIVTKADEVNAIALKNLGGADYLRQIKYLKLWLDRGEPGFQGMGVDQELGNLNYSSGAETWYLDNLNIDISDNLRFFVTVETYSLVQKTETIQMQFPALLDKNQDGLFQVGDLGIFMASGNNGPTDSPLTNINMQVFSTSGVDNFGAKIVVTNLHDGELINDDHFTIEGLARDQGGHDFTIFQIMINDQTFNITDYDSQTYIWQYYWQNIADGDYTLQVKAYDNLGNLGESEPVKISVKKQTLATENSQFTINKDTILNTGLDPAKITISLKDIENQPLPNRAVACVGANTIITMSGNQTDVNGQLICEVRSTKVGVKNVEVSLEGLILTIFSINVIDNKLSSSINFGDLIKGSGLAVYYYGSDGQRYVFPNEKVYGSWYADFSQVKTISDEALASIAIAGNVTYRPGVKLVKITTDPKVYAVSQGGVLHWLQTAEIAQGLYGKNWEALIQDVPDTFFVNYIVSSPITQLSDYNPTAEQGNSQTINQDKNLEGKIQPTS